MGGDPQEEKIMRRGIKIAKKNCSEGKVLFG
jgi:hypothetical protein